MSSRGHAKGCFLCCKIIATYSPLCNVQMIDNSNTETLCSGIIKGNESGDEKQSSFPGPSSIYYIWLAITSHSENSANHNCFCINSHVHSDWLDAPVTCVLWSLLTRTSTYKLCSHSAWCVPVARDSYCLKSYEQNR